MFASGTISGPTKAEFGSLLELTTAGKEKIKIEETGEERVFLQDGDSVNLTGECKGDGFVIGFGNCEGTIQPSLDDGEYF